MPDGYDSERLFFRGRPLAVTRFTVLDSQLAFVDLDSVHEELAANYKLFFPYACAPERVPRSELSPTSHPSVERPAATREPDDDDIPF